MTSLWIGIGVFAAAVVLTGVVLAVLRRKAVMDVPNARSNHQVPVPRGGGIAVTGVILAGWSWLAASGVVLPAIWPVIAGVTLLAVVSFVDDVKGLLARWRFLAQMVAVGAVLWSLGDMSFTQWAPLWLERLFLALAWLWFINLTNFMDGIDGITGVEITGIAGGVGLLAVMGYVSEQEGWYALVMGAAVLGFLPWNWHKAKIFLGDVGSVPLGFMAGYLLLLVTLHGYWFIALMLPAYYWADATVTLLRRLFRGEKVWEAHSEHFYQKAVRGGRSHGWVVAYIGFVNLGLVMLSGLTMIGAVPVEIGLVMAVLMVGVVMGLFRIQGLGIRG